MNVSVSYKSDYIKNQFSQKTKNITFQSNNNQSDISSNKKHGSLKVTAPFVLAGFIALGGIKGCNVSNESRYSGLDNFNDINVEYTDVQKKTRDSVMIPVYDMKSHLSSDNDFLDGVKFEIASSFDNISSNDKFNKYLIERNTSHALKGTSFYSDRLLPKRIAIQEENHQISDKMYSQMRHTLMHEVGHHFDNYFGHDHNADCALRWDSLMYSKDNPYDFPTVTKDDIKLDVQYNSNNSLSDKSKFKLALLKDLRNISNIGLNSNILPDNLEYFVKDIDFNHVLMIKDIENANSSRAEIYAHLFSYACGQDDGDKEKFINCFKNSYDIVCRDIENYIQ